MPAFAGMTRYWSREGREGVRARVSAEAFTSRSSRPSRESLVTTGPPRALPGGTASSGSDALHFLRGPSGAEPPHPTRSPQGRGLAGPAISPLSSLSLAGGRSSFPSSPRATSLRHPSEGWGPYGRRDGSRSAWMPAFAGMTRYWSHEGREEREGVRAPVSAEAFTSRSSRPSREPLIAARSPARTPGGDQP